MDTKDEHEEFFKVMTEISSALSDIELKRQEIIQELISVKGNSYPEKLYHYTGCLGVLGIIESNNLWATEYQSLNDSTEIIFGTQKLITVLEKFYEDNKSDSAILLRKLCDYYKEHGDLRRAVFNTSIISFSEEPDVLSQWRAYSDQAEGYCIEFDLTDSRLFTIFDQTNPWAMEIIPAIYDESLQLSLVQSGISKILEFVDSTEWTVSRIVNSSELEQGVALGCLMHVFDVYSTAFKTLHFLKKKSGGLWLLVPLVYLTLVKK